MSKLSISLIGDLVLGSGRSTYQWERHLWRSREIHRKWNKVFRLIGYQSIRSIGKNVQIEVRVDYYWESALERCNEIIDNWVNTVSERLQLDNVFEVLLERERDKSG